MGSNDHEGTARLNDLAASRRPHPVFGWHVIDEVDLAAVLADRAEARALCAALERVADALPALPAAEQAAALCAALTRFDDARQLRIEQLAGKLTGRSSGPIAKVILAHIRACHSLDSIHALDLASALDEAVRDEASTPALGYMLRCFFDGCRRAMMFEQLALIHLAGPRMTRGAAAALNEALVSTRG